MGGDGRGGEGRLELGNRAMMSMCDQDELILLGQLRCR